MPSAQRGFGHLLMILVLFLLALCVVAAIWLIMQQPQSPNELSRIQPASAQESTGSGVPAVQVSSVPVATVAPTPIVTASPVPAISLDGAKTYHGRAITFPYPADWRYDNKNTSSQLFGVLHFMNVLDFDQEDSTAKDPEGKLLGRIELKYFSNGDLTSKTIEDYIADHFKYGSPEVASTRQLGGVEVVEVHHKNCGAANDCINVIAKNGPTIYDWQINNLDTKQQDLQLVYSMLNQASYK